MADNNQFNSDDYENPRKLRKLNDNQAISSSGSSANKNYAEQHLKVFHPDNSPSSNNSLNSNRSAVKDGGKPNIDTN